MANQALQLSRQWLRGLDSGTVRLAYHSALPIALITLNHPEKHNALTGKMIAEFADCIDTLEVHRSKLAALIINGASPSYCSGLDLHFVDQHVNTPENARRISALMKDSLSRMSKFPFISFSAIEGVAIGGGAELALATDFRVVTYGTMLQFVHFKLGASTIFGGASRLERLIGQPKALQLLLSCKKLDGDACYKLGMAQWISKSGDSLRTCVDVVAGFLDVSIPESTSPLEEAFLENASWIPQGLPHYSGRALASLHALKSNVMMSHFNSLNVALDHEQEALTSCWGSTQHLKAIKASL
ncbi:enoyl CoA hydratase domain-containing protein 1 [Coelomomyces lativittatus]|nr:enoyl CoA hydratase domain-containing protein 1 [Coelomomyces lativittatus]KAJ1510053.1 enoyl CoA hydratase domain-containing protein 1 [Coelomomyces lativittatus]KAJ1514122.1 enoyl CoA hydratase domain-containing protein 1 [Coelomomyces lativittatus]